jgi:hypothetical protein
VDLRRSSSREARGPSLGHQRTADQKGRSAREEKEKEYEKVRKKCKGKKKKKVKVKEYEKVRKKGKR